VSDPECSGVGGLHPIFLPNSLSLLVLGAAGAGSELTGMLRLTFSRAGAARVSVPCPNQPLFSPSPGLPQEEVQKKPLLGTTQ
jgi:hypothetical protein